jgi:hypothetical protein
MNEIELLMQVLCIFFFIFTPCSLAVISAAYWQKFDRQRCVFASTAAAPIAIFLKWSESQCIAKL